MLAAPRPAVFSHHPRQFYILATAELFERIAGTIVSASLILYFTERLGLGVGQATSQAGTFLALTYLTPLIGGFLADRVLSYRSTLLLGTVLLLAGYVVLSLDVPRIFYASLGLLIFGQGLFRPSIVAALGRLYDRDPTQRDSGFSRFYIAVNVGSALGPLIGSAGKAAWGWSGAFLSAVVAVGICLLTLAAGLARHQSEIGPQREGTASSVALSNLRLIGLLLFVLVIYFAAYMQTTSTMLLLARDKTERVLWGREVPVGVIAALPAVNVVALSSVGSLFFSHWPARRGLRAKTKIFCGLLLSSLAFLLLAGAAQLGAENHKLPLGILILAIVLLSVGELLVSPIGQSLLSELAPASLSAFTNSLWYGAVAAGVWGGGLLGAFYERWSAAAFFGGCSGLVVGAVVVMRFTAHKRAV